MKAKLFFLSFILFLSLGAISQSIQSFSPSIGNAGEMIQVSITGQNTTFQQGTDIIRLTNGSTVLSPQQTTFVNDTLIEPVFAFNKDNPTGYYNLSIQKNGGYTLNLSSCFYLNTDPTIAVIDSVYPTSANQGETILLTIKGLNTNFGSAGAHTTVWLKQGAQQINGSNIVVVDSVTIRAQFAFTYGHSTGTYDVCFYNVLDGSVTDAGGFVLNAGPNIPVIVSCLPSSGNQGEFLTVSITGQNTNFQQGTDVISLSSGSTTISPQQSTFLSNTLIQSVFAFNKDNPTGYYNLSIQKNGSYTLNLNNCFLLNADPTIASVVSVLPSVANQGETVTLTITGLNTNFGSAGTTTTASLKKGTQQINPTSLIVIDSVTIQAQFVLTYGYTSGLYNVCVSNTLDGSLILTGGFTINAGSGVPTITAVTPNTGLLGETLTVSITGQNTIFQQGTDNVHLSQGSTYVYPSSISFVNATMLNATFTFASNLPSGYYDVNMTGNDLITLVNGFNLALSIDTSTYVTPITSNDTTVITVSPNAFDFANYLGANLNYTATLGDGSPLPGNVIFDPLNLTITILPAKDNPSGTVVITATDDNNNSASVSIPIGQYLYTAIGSYAEENFNFSVFPNPASDKIILDIQQSKVIQNCYISIYNVNGQLVLRESLIKPQTEIDISKLNKGFYLIQLNNDGNTTIKSIIKE
jgi:hypothetical protein